MRITAISDIHGSLIPIEQTDLLFICGDFSPLMIQQNLNSMRNWIDDELLNWFEEIEAQKIVLIAGNHDFVCDNSLYEIPLNNAPEIDFNENILKPMLKRHNLLKKVNYLENSSLNYKGLKIFGCPNVEGCYGWAFSSAEITEIYDSIPNCDILLTHQAPLIGKLGYVDSNKRRKEFGSNNLKDAILKIKPKFVFCGHIHDGCHSEQIIRYEDHTETHIFNVSIKNENYRVTHKPLILTSF